MKVTIPRRWSSNPISIEDVPDDSPNPMRAAVEQFVSRARLTGARLTGADLTGADLTDADLTDADLTDADLTGARLTRADLTRADLTGADLTGADLTGAKEDFRGVLDAAPNEVAGLLLAVQEGRIDGSHYEGECACLKGTIANIRGCSYQSLGDSDVLAPDSSRPSERLFMGISPGHVPAINPVAKIVEGWILEWQAERVAKAVAP